MPDLHELDSEKGILFVHSSGVLSKDELAASVAKVVEVAASDEVVGVLVDARELRSLPGTGDVFNIFAQFPVTIRVAIVVGDQPSAEDVRFIETIATNRGGHIRVFIARNDAESWLTGTEG